MLENQHKQEKGEMGTFCIWEGMEVMQWNYLTAEKKIAI